MQAAERGRDPLTRPAAREHSLEGVPESTGYVLFIPDHGGQGQWVKFLTARATAGAVIMEPFRESGRAVGGRREYVLYEWFLLTL